jgi:uncharacterized protein YndB with AHSA1/START domain
MAYESLSLSELIPASGDQIYSAWLNSVEHSAFTGDKAEIEPMVGGKHSSFDGYAQGTIVDLQPGRRIVQTWRTSDFPDGSPDSRLELTLEVTVGGTMLTLLHTEIPDGQSDNYRDGWVKHYLDPLKRFFAERTVPDLTVLEGEDEADHNHGNGVSESRSPATRIATRAKSPAAPPAAPIKSAAKTKPKAVAKPARPPKVKAKAAPKAKTKAKVTAKAKAKPKAKVQVKAKAKAKARTKARPIAARAAARKKVAAKPKVKAKTRAKKQTKTRKAARPKAKRRR